MSNDKEIKVVHCKKEPYDIYIGRPSKWGNPFSIGKDGTREEVIEKYREWINLIDFKTENKRFKINFYDNDFTVNNIYDTFDRLFSKFKRSKIVLSYKKGGVPSINYLRRLMKQYKSNVFTRSKHYKYALNKQNGESDKNREVIIIGK